MNFRPINNKCLNCGKEVNPQVDRQELTFDENDNCRRICGACIAKLEHQPAKSAEGKANRTHA